MNHLFMMSFFGAFILGFVVSSSSQGEDLKNAVDVTKTKSTQKIRHPKITISKDITYVEGPLRTDGYVDYLAALNKFYSQDITPENNAAIHFIKVVGPKALEKETRKKYFQLLGIPELPEEGSYLVPMDEFILSYKGWKVSDSYTPEAEEWSNEISKQIDEALIRPWSKEEFPVIAALLEKNAVPLNLLRQGIQLPRFYSPIVSKDDSLLKCNLILSLGCREINRQLVMRAMLRLHSGNIDGAWDDIMTGNRLGRLVGQGPFLIDWLVGSGVARIMDAGTVSLVHFGNITTEQSRRFQVDLNKLPPMQPIKNCLDKGERFIVLDSLLDIAVNGYKIPVIPSEFEKVEYFIELHKKSEPICKAIKKLDDDSNIDWNDAFGYINDWHDRMVEAYSKPKTIQRKEAIAKLEEELLKLNKVALDNIQSNNVISENTNDKTITRQFIHLIMQSGLFSDWEIPSLNIENRHKVYTDFNLILLALAGYRYDQKCYPKNLAELCPKYIDELPKDVFSDGDYHYKIEKDGYSLYSVGPNGKDDGGKNFNQDTDFDNVDESKFSEEEKSTDDIAIRVPPKK